MTEVYAIVSGKGGVGKTFLSINLSYALASFGKKVLLIDANLTTPNIIVNLKIPEPSYYLQDVLKDKVSVREAIVPTEFGFEVIPASLSLQDLIGTDPEKLSQVVYELSGLYDYIILDTSASLGRETLSAIKAAENTLVITTPEKASLVDAYKVIKLSDVFSIPVFGVVLNKFNANEDKVIEIESYLGRPVISAIPESSKVKQSLNKGIPFLKLYPDSKVSKEIKKLAAKMANVEFEEETKKKESFIDKILKIFKK